MKKLQRILEIRNELKNYISIIRYNGDKLKDVDGFLCDYYNSLTGINKTVLSTLYLEQYNLIWATEEDIWFLEICYEDVLRRLKIKYEKEHERVEESN